MKLTNTILTGISWIILTIALPIYLTFKASVYFGVDPDGTAMAVILVAALAVFGLLSWRLANWIL